MTSARTNMRLAVACVLAVVCGPCFANADKAMCLVEAESFDDPGGWVVDQQFMDQMGSPFLLAHGLGVPVQDAVTTVTLPATGLVPRLGPHAGLGRETGGRRTEDGGQNAVGQDLRRPSSVAVMVSAGRFQLLIDGKPLGATFGTEDAAWHWQDGGTVEIKSPRVQARPARSDGFRRPLRCDPVFEGPGLHSSRSGRRHWRRGDARCWACRKRRRRRGDSISSWSAAAWRGPARPSRPPAWDCRWP